MFAGFIPVRQGGPCRHLGITSAAASISMVTPVLCMEFAVRIASGVLVYRESFINRKDPCSSVREVAPPVFERLPTGF